MASIKELAEIRYNYLSKNWKYQRKHYKLFDYKILDNCLYYKSHKFRDETFNDITIMIDSETSKSESYCEEKKDNHVVIWTMSIRLFDISICTLYGRKPSELCECIEYILKVLKGDKTYMYIFNLGYDYVFFRKFFIKYFGYPVRQLNVKSHYPISIEYSNGLVLKDALILAQRKLEKWAKDLNVEHQKAVGDWDYNKIRHQNTNISDNELHYAEFDTLSGTECIDKLKNQLNKNIGTMPLTSTGILREIIKKAGAQNHAKKWFNKNCPTYEQYKKWVAMYHGGFTHGNRHYLGEVIKKPVKGYDFASSYPFCLFLKYPSGKFVPVEPKSVQYVIENKDKYAFMFKLIAVDIELINDEIPMPFLQFSKCEYTINALVDNGRIIAADYVEIWLNEIDLDILMNQYKIKKSICANCEVALKDYLPKWFTDIVFELFKDKTQLKGIDPIRYVIQKYKLNACYGLCCQRWDKCEIIELEDGSYLELNEKTYNELPATLKEQFKDKFKTSEELFNDYISKRSTILPYIIGVYCTSYATRNLFRLGGMCETWLYSDTDSCYGINWNEEKVKQYNENCIKFIESRGYSGVEHNGRMYYLGVAENDDDSNYSEFIYHGAKRYAGRCVADNEIHITVAGVPKISGAKCLNTLDDFQTGFIFSGTKTGKLLHTHNYVDEIYINEYGDEVGDSIDLSPCDYQLDTAIYHSLSDYINEGYDIEIECAQDMEELFNE